LITGVGFVVTAATGGTGTLPYLYGLAASTGASIVLDGQVQQKIAIADYSGAVDQATYHLPGLGSSRSLVEALSEGNILGAVLSFGSLGMEVLPFLRGVRVPGVGKEGIKATQQFISFEQKLANASPKVQEGYKFITQWLGEGSRAIINKNGDLVLMSKDGLKKIRFDINKPYPHIHPHTHIEQFINGQWVKGQYEGVPQLYPKDVPRY
jgi:hypothetical protein